MYARMEAYCEELSLSLSAAVSGLPLGLLMATKAFLPKIE